MLLGVNISDTIPTHTYRLIIVAINIFVPKVLAICDYTHLILYGYNYRYLESTKHQLPIFPHNIRNL